MIAAQIADGGDWKTSFLLVNTASQTGSYTLTFTDDNGRPLLLPLDSGGGTTVSGKVPPNGLAVISTLGSTIGQTVQGWAQLQASAGVGGLAVFRQRVAGRPDFEASLPFQAPQSSPVIPFDNTSGSATGIALANPSSSPLSIRIAVYDADSGDLYYPSGITLAPNSHTAFSLATNYPALMRRRGWVALDSSTQTGGPGAPFGALGLRFNSTGPFTSMPPMTSVGFGAVAQLADGAGWQTELVLANSSPSDTYCALNLYTDNGGLLQLPTSATSQSLDDCINHAFFRTRARFFQSDGTAGSTTTGWASLNGPAGLAIFTQKVSGGLTFEASVPFQAPSSAVAIPFDNTNGYVTGVAIANTFQVESQILLTYYNEFGQLLFSQPITLDAHGHTSFAMTNLSPLAANIRGVMTLVSNNAAEITAVGLRFNPTGPFTSLWPVAYGTGGLVTAFLPDQFTYKGSWLSYTPGTPLLAANVVTMNDMGTQTLINGSISNTGDTYSAPGSTYPWAMLDGTRNVVLMHPGDTAGAVWQYCPGQGGNFRAQGAFARANDDVAGTGVEVRIFVNDDFLSPQFSFTIDPTSPVDPTNYFRYQVPFDVSVQLAMYNCLRFGVFATQSKDFDATALRLVITGTSF